MQNVDITYENDGATLVIKVDLNQRGTPSASGKTLVIASTRGNVELEGGVRVGLNVYKPRTQ